MAKARVYITCDTCGCEFEHSKVCYNRADAERYEEWAREHITTCPKCWRDAKREQEVLDAAKAVDDAGVELPELVGSEKQVKWASELRVKAILMFAKLNAKPIAYEKIAERTDAHWWIEQRDEMYSAKNFYKVLSTR